MARYKIVILFCLMSLNVLSQIQSTSIQLINNSTGKDTYTNSSAPTADNSGEYVLSTYVDGSNVVPRYRRSYLKIDLSSIPQGAIIVDADLRLTKISGYDNTPTELSVIAEDWWDYDTDHNNQPNVVYTSPSSTVQVPIGTGHTTSSGNYYSHTFDVTDQVQYMSNYSHLNFGWRLKSEDESVDCQYFTDINGNTQYVCDKRGATYRSGYASFVNSPSPILFIDYVLPIEVSLNTVEHADVPNSSNGSISINASQGNGVYSYQWIDGSTGSDMPGETGTTINGLLPGWYGVKVTDGLGNISYMAFVVGAKCGEVTIEFQPDGRFVDDTHVISGVTPNVPTNYPNMNFGSGTILYTDRYFQNLPYYNYNREFLIRNRIIISDNIELNSAEQYLYGVNHYSQFGNECVLKNISEDWNENIVTWNTKPNYGSSIVTIPSTTPQTQNISLNLTNLYNDYQNGTVTNKGQSMLLNYPPSNLNRRVGFASSDHGSSDMRPKLVLHLGKICQKGYVTLKRTLDASYTFTKLGTLHFSFSNDYEQLDNDLSIKLYDSQRVEIPLTGSEYILYDDNRVKLDLNGMGLINDRFYFIEVYLTKGERRYLRFQYKNS